MVPKVIVDEVVIPIADWGVDIVRGEWYVPREHDHKNPVNRIFCKEGFEGVCIPIDPRYDHDQNRMAQYYRDCYRGEPELWNYVEGTKPCIKYAPYESDWQAWWDRHKDVTWHYQYEWLEDPTYPK